MNFFNNKLIDINNALKKNKVNYIYLIILYNLYIY